MFDEYLALPCFEVFDVKFDSIYVDIERRQKFFRVSFIVVAFQFDLLIPSNRYVCYPSGKGVCSVSLRTWSSLGTVLVARWIFEHISKTAHLNSAISASLVSPKTLARDANLSSLIASCLLKMVVDALKCVGERYTAGLPCTLLCGSRLVGRRLLGDVCSLFSCIGGEVLMIIPNAVPLGVGGSKGGATTILISVSFL
ncbi:unnamed protein product [Arabidopsis thaliana]|uniref:(thale cress) hypothetical protein n=1 Tax=Arabidopsis thaliana TaxID=3702 RepID=A0A7G2FKA6_ARATH|nr:unnamed protein product [Arabidopsis thaliana]